MRRLEGINRDETCIVFGRATFPALLMRWLRSHLDLYFMRCAFFLLVWLPAVVTAQTSFEIAFLRSDGILLPILQNEEGRWETIPETASLPEQWYFHAPSGALWRMDLGPKARNVPGGYLTGFTVRPPKAGQPAKTGIAVSPRRPLIRMDALPEPRLPAGFRVPAPFEVEAVYRSLVDIDGEVLYVVRSTNGREGSGCRRLESWVVQDARRTLMLDRQEYACDATSATEPLGVLPMEGLRSAYVVAEVGHGVYGVFEISRGGVHALSIRP